MEYSGVGTGYFNNAIQINNINFKVRVSNNDVIRGSLKCIVSNSLLIEELKDKMMTIIGVTNSDYVSIEINYILFSHSIDDGIESYEGHATEAKFSAGELLINQYLLNILIT